MLSETTVTQVSTRRVQRRILYITLVTCCIFCIFSFTDSGWAPVLTPLSTRLQITLDNAGLLYVWWTTGYLPGALIGGTMLDRYGPRLVFLCASLLVLAGISALYISLLLRATTLLVLLPMAGLAGIGGGIIDASSNGLISSLFVRRRGMALNLFNLLFSLGGVVVPLVDAGLFTLFHNDPLPPLLFTVGFILVVMLLLPGMPRSYQKEEVRDEPKERLPLKLLLIPLLPVVLAMFFTNGISTALRVWTPTYLHVAYTLTPASAAALSSITGATSILSRLTAALIITRIGSWRMIMFCVLVTLSGLMTLLFSTYVLIAMVAIAVAIAGIAPIFATLLTIGSERGGRALGSVAGVLLCATGVSTVFCSWFFGFLLHATGRIWPIIFATIFVICGGLMAFQLKRGSPSMSSLTSSASGAATDKSRDIV